MPTVVLDAYSKAYPTITNRIRASVFLESDPVALISTIIDTTSGHPARLWHFPGLPRANYGFSLDEIDGSDIVVQNLALFSVVPGNIDGALVRNDEQIQVGTTTGFDAGLTSVTFDGTGGKPNYIGWEIVPSELQGRGILVRGVDYSWDSTTGIITLLQPADELQAGVWWNIHFNPIQNPAGGSVATVLDFSTRVITTSANIAINDFGNNIICEPDGNYMELTLPDIETVPQGRPVRIETKPSVGTSVQCVKFLTTGADTINYLRGNLYMMNNESIEIYRLKREDDSNEWRIRCAVGNFGAVGQTVSDDQIVSDLICKILLDGSSKNKYQFARLYNEYVLNLPSAQLCDYDDWATGNNKYLYSRANSTDPGNADEFHVPDRRGLFERNNNTGKSGDYESDKIKTLDLSLQIRNGSGGSATGTMLNTGFSGQDNPAEWLDNFDGLGNPKYIKFLNTGQFGSETQPKNYLINKYALI